jgi:hypothetical protein
MLVLDALFDHFHQISSSVEIIGSLLRQLPPSCINRPAAPPGGAFVFEVRQ